MDNEENIHFHGPFSLCSYTDDILYDCPYASEYGIYIWTVKIASGNHKLIYIGETGTSFYRRTKEHLIQILGGNYQICNPEVMKLDINEVIWNGLWRKCTRNKFPEFLSRYEILAPSIKKFAINLNIFVAPNKLNARLRKRIEGTIARTILSDINASTFFPKDIRYYIRKEIDEPVFFRLSSDKHIVGLPDQLYA